MGYAETTYSQEQMQIIGFDMGGTSTDVSRYDGNYDHVFESTIAGVCIQAPQVSTIMLWYTSGPRVKIVTFLYFFTLYTNNYLDLHVR